MLVLPFAVDLSCIAFVMSNNLGCSHLSIRGIVFGEGLRQPNDKVRRIWQSDSGCEDILLRGAHTDEFVKGNNNRARSMQVN